MQIRKSMIKNMIRMLNYIKRNGTLKDWKQLQEEYPDKWAIITNMKYNKNQELIRFDLIAICTVDERTEYLRKLFKENIEFETVRTIVF